MFPNYILLRPHIYLMQSIKHAHWRRLLYRDVAFNPRNRSVPEDETFLLMFAISKSYQFLERRCVQHVSPFLTLQAGPGGLSDNGVRRKCVGPTLAQIIANIFQNWANVARCCADVGIRYQLSNICHRAQQCAENEIRFIFLCYVSRAELSVNVTEMQAPYFFFSVWRVATSFTLWCFAAGGCISCVSRKLIS